MAKQQIKLGACKGKLLPILLKCLEEFGINTTIASDSRKVYYEFENDRYIFKVYIMRYNDLVRYGDYFDLLLYGVDQYLENNSGCNMVIKYFDQDNCRLAVLKNNNSNKDVIDKVSTNYYNCAQTLLGLPSDKIVRLDGSLEVAPFMNLADFVLDIIVTGKSAAINDLTLYKEIFKVGAVVATRKPFVIDMLREMGLIDNKNNPINIAIDGIDGSGKSTLSKILLHSRINDCSSLMIAPFHSDVAQDAFLLWQKGDYGKWARMVGKFPSVDGVNLISDRSVITCLTDLIDNNYSKEEILSIIKEWNMPDVLFFIDIPLEIAIKRNHMKGDSDEFDTDEQIYKYFDLYRRGAQFLIDNDITQVLTIDGTMDIASEVNEIKRTLNRKLERRNNNGIR